MKIFSKKEKWAPLMLRINYSTLSDDGELMQQGREGECCVAYNICFEVWS